MALIAYPDLAAAIQAVIDGEEVTHAPLTVPHPFIDGVRCPVARVTGEDTMPITDVWVAPIENRDGLQYGLVGEYQRDDGTDKSGERIWNPVYSGDASDLYRTAWEAPILTPDETYDEIVAAFDDLFPVE